MKKKRECPKCKSRFGVVLCKNICKENSEIICFHASCDFKMNIVEWNKKHKNMIFKY